MRIVVRGFTRGCCLATMVAIANGQAPPADPTNSVRLSADEEMAVAAAEAFVQDNCYTSVACDEAGMQPELMESARYPQIMLLLRRNSLKPRAYGVSPHTKGGLAPGWTVYFERTDEWLRKFSIDSKDAGLRGVELGIRFDGAVLVHLDLRRDAPAKRVSPPSGS